MTVPSAAIPSVVSRIKIVSGLDIAERRRPQDGRAKLTVDGLTVEARISTLPTLTAGRTAVLRFALSNLKPGVAPLANAILELEIVAPNPTEYRFTNPKIGGNTAVVQLTGLHVLVKPSAVAGPGSEDTNQGDTWDTISASIPVSTLPNPLPTTPLSMTPLDTRAIAVGAYSSTGDLNDTITVGFDVLQ